MCSKTSRSEGRYGKRGDFNSIVDDAFSSMFLLLTSVSQGIGACFVGWFEDEKMSKILNLSGHVKPKGIIRLDILLKEQESIRG